MRLQRFVAVVVAAGGLAGCGGGSASGGAPGVGGGPGDEVIVDPPATVAVTRSLAQRDELAALTADLATVRGYTTGDLLAAHPVPFVADLGYSPRDALGFDLLQASHLALTDSELAVLDQHGFVLVDRRGFPTFTWGYSAVYADDLPVFVSVDSILFAMHQSYDELLRELELAALEPLVTRMLTSMHTTLAASGLGGDQLRDLDLYLTVARSLASGTSVTPVVGSNATLAQQIVGQAELAPAAWEAIELFGVKRNLDYSQFKPRGHYADDPALERYFRAMMWLGRLDFRFIETQPDGTQALYRRQVQDAVALRDLMNAEARADWDALDTVIGAFVGEHDSMTPRDVDALLAALGVTDAAGLASKSDTEIAQAIAAGGFGAQRIMSQVLIKEGAFDETLPLDNSFLLMGQRYVVDSHVFSNVVYDRVVSDPRRQLPDPLDVAYAALGNDQAAALLAPELDRYGYAPELEATRRLAEAGGDEAWHTNLYTTWLGALRQLSPALDEAGLPTVARTEAWGRRMLNAQLASWAELRHDTILYAKQSYTSGVLCEYPDGYVDPYPEAFRAIASFAERGEEVIATLQGTEAIAGTASLVLSDANAYFVELAAIANRLGDMAESQRTGAPHSAEQIAFLNETVTVSSMCGGASADGWYPRLFFHADPTEFDPTIADVHTAPLDGGGMEVLLVGTGYANLLVTTVETCTGPRLYAGPVSSYYEVVRPDRLTDDEWQAELPQHSPRDVAWMSDLFAPATP